MALQHCERRIWQKLPVAVPVLKGGNLRAKPRVPSRNQLLKSQNKRSLSSVVCASSGLPRFFSQLFLWAKVLQINDVVMVH